MTRVMCLLLAVPVPSFVGAWPQRRHGDTCQAQAMDVATMGGAVFGTSVALIFGYDWASRKELERPYLEMRVVDASTNEEGDELMRRVEALTVLEGEGREGREGPEPSRGDPGSGWSRVYGVYGVAEPPEKSSYQSEALRISGEDSDLVIDGKPWEESFGELLERRWSETGGVVSDTGARLAWEREIRKAEANKTSTLTSWPKGTSTWAFEFRSYTNQEELNAMLAAKPGLQQLLLRPASRTSLQVDGEIAELEDNFLLLGGLVVVKIRWRGKALASMLRWDTSEAVLSSSVLPWLQRTFDRPAAAERLRKDPWELTAMVEPTVSGIKRSVAVLRRVGAGRLVFMKQ